MQIKLRNAYSILLLLQMVYNICDFLHYKDYKHSKWRRFVVNNVAMKVLLVEDDESECTAYRAIIKKNNKVNLVAVTSSSTEALEYVEKYNPDAVILDLELNKGEGNGIDFIQTLNMKPKKTPKIVVTTNIYSESVYDFLHKSGVDFIFYKHQTNFSRENVISILLLLNEYKAPNTIKDLSFVEDSYTNKVEDLINNELELIGVSGHLKGRKYLYDAIYYIIEHNSQKEHVSIIQYLVGKYKRAGSTISRAMQNAILHAWRISDLEDLSNLYTARISYETGVPTPTEFIYYYADKIKKCL